MEKIKINDIQKKGVVCIVKYCADGCNPDEIREATLNVNFNAQEISYLKNDVGIGGTVDVEITNKPKNPDNLSMGYWVNITKVNFESAQKDTVKGTVNDAITSNESSETIGPEANLMPQREIGMCAGGMLKCYFYNRTPKDMMEVVNKYRAFVLELEQNG